MIGIGLRLTKLNKKVMLVIFFFFYYKHFQSVKALKNIKLLAIRKMAGLLIISCSWMIIESCNFFFFTIQSMKLWTKTNTHSVLLDFQRKR